jgi:hypothetical protein
MRIGDFSFAFTTPRAVKQNLVMSLAGFGLKNDSAGEVQQQFTIPTDFSLTILESLQVFYEVHYSKGRKIAAGLRQHNNNYFLRLRIWSSVGKLVDVTAYKLEPLEFPRNSCCLTSKSTAPLLCILVDRYQSLRPATSIFRVE